MDWATIIEKIRQFDEQRIISQQYINFWAENELFTWRWWLKVAMLVLPWVIWWFLRKKESTGRLLLAGFFTAVLSSYLDETGANMGLWINIAVVNPYVVSNTSYNLAMLPVTTMLFIQFFPKLKPVWKAIIYAAAGAFISEPLLSLLGIYRLEQWEYWYSFPILFVQYWIAHRLTLLKSFRPAFDE